MRNIILTLLSLVLFGCAGSFEEARLAGPPPRSSVPSKSAAQDDYCRGLDNERMTWGAISKGAAALSGASGVSAIPVEGEDAKVALAVTSTGLAALAVVSFYVEEGKGEAWVRDCSQR
jgi:hypothetical protein